MNMNSRWVYSRFEAQLYICDCSVMTKLDYRDDYKIKCYQEWETMKFQLFRNSQEKGLESRDLGP